MKHDPFSDLSKLGCLGIPVSRRQALRRTLFAATGLFFGRHLSFASPTAGGLFRGGKAKAVIQIWMWGGPSHLDTFDPKPEAGSDYCGPLIQPIRTNVEGMMLNELLPQLAKQADKYSLIRSMTHNNNAHETASYMVQTGHPDGDHVVYPSIGAVVSLLKGYEAGYKGLIPPYIVLTAPQGRFSEAGFLGPRYKPFATGGDPAKTPFAVQGIVADGISPKRQELRRDLLHELDSLGKTLPDNASLAEFRKAEEGAYDMILGDGAKTFNLAEEPDAVRQWYGMNTFGQSCLTARRLVERGVRFVTVNNNGWDTHKENFPTLKRKLPEFDAGVAALLQDLASRGLLDSTIVLCCGEFGRTPKVQMESPWNGGRSHWGKVFSSLVAGGGFKGGHIVGASDARGEEVKDRPVYPWDLLGSIYELLDIDPNGTFPRVGDGNLRLTQTPAGLSGGLLREIM